MAGLGLAAGYGAGAAGATLGDILKQKFLEQMQRQKLAEDMRQADLQHQTQMRGLDIGEGRLGLDTQRLGEEMKQHGIVNEREATRVGYEGERLGMDKAEQPVRLAHLGAETGEILRRPTAEVEKRTFEEKMAGTQHGYQMGEIGARTAGALRVADRERASDWQIVDRPDGGKVRVNRLTGEEQPLAQAGKAAAGAGGKGAVSEEYAKERQRRITQSVDEMAKQTDWTTVGPAAYANGLPATPALAFKKQLDTLHANIAFGELAEMRAASKTGGALGQVSDKEGNLLQSTLGALDQKMSPEQFKGQLAKIKDTLTRWNAAKAADAAAKNTTGGLGVQTGAGGGGGGTVRMKAPDGSVKPVPADQVEHFKSLGAVVVK